MSFRPWQRPSAPATLGNHEDRILAIERQLAKAGTGIRFDTYPQDGNWLYVETTDDSGSPNGWGVEFNDSGANGGFWVHTESTLLLFANLGASLGSSDGIGGEIIFSVTGTDVSTGHYKMTINSDVQYEATVFDHIFQLPASGGKFEVRDKNGVALFRVDSDGDLHGLTGKALTFDL